ncbi:MAG TPA: TIR domain-containing protein [Rubrivivax sp.]|nr:TIR domain-containing protein [Rubrivivax sp.]
MSPPRVFFSYSHDSREHREAVLGLAERMRLHGGIDARVDRYVAGSPDEGWPRWMLNEIDAADHVLVICTPAYYRRFRGHEVPGQGKGADWEGAIITQELYDRRSVGRKFVPVLLGPAHETCIPEPLRSATHYTLASSDEYRRLCLFLRGEAGVDPSPVAVVPRTPRATARPIEFDDERALRSPIDDLGTAASRARAVWGRGALLAKLIPTLKDSGRLVLFGMRGIGKSRVIETIARHEPWSDWGAPLHVFAGATRHYADVFRTVAQSLGVLDENPRPPVGSVDEMVADLSKRIGSLRPILVWVDHAHCWFDRGQWASPELRRLVTALERVTAGKWNWIFEFREHPPDEWRPAAFEVPGLDKEALAKWFEAAAPEEQRQDWALSGDRLRAMYQWLGGGHGQQAHPLATSLLIEVALGTHSTPLQVRQRLISEPARQIENLLSDLFENVLSEAERQLLLALGLYRNWVPHDHLAALEAGLAAEDAWFGLERRCLLPSDEHQERFFLHGFVSDWLRQRLGYPADDSDRTGTARGPAASRRARELHRLIADCWLRQLEQAQHRSILNTERAVEAFHHLIAGDQSDRLHEIAPGLIAGREDGALERLWLLCDSLHASRRPRQELELVLRVILELDPRSHKALRFLGETLQRVRGPGDAEAIECFRRAFELRSDFAPYLCNLGVALKATGVAGARKFLGIVDAARRECQAAVNDQVIAVEAQCLTALSPDSDEPSRRRRARIEGGSQHEAIYTDEAEWQLRRRPPDAAEALCILDIALHRGCHGEFAAVARAKALEILGRSEEAQEVRADLIRRGARNAAVYHGEALSLLHRRRPDPVRALEVLDMADRLQCADDYTASIRANALELAGRGDEASQLRTKHIESGSRSEVFYTDEADWQLSKKPPDVEEAMRILALAEARGCATDYTVSVQAKALEAAGRTEEASALRQQQITAGSANAVFFVAEAHWQLRKHEGEAAIRILDLASQRGCADEHAASVRASALEALGRDKEASELRTTLISGGSRSAAIYNAEAEWLLSQESPRVDEALELLSVPLRDGFADQFTTWVEARARRLLSDRGGSRSS